LVEVVESEYAGGSAQDFSPAYSPNPFGRCVEVRDAIILVEDHNSVIGLLERGQQDVGTFH
jgi:hypothetical protein